MESGVPLPFRYTQPMCLQTQNRRRFMFLEILTFIMLILVLVLKYGTVTRMVKLNQRLRDAEAKCKRVKERLKQFRN